MIPFRFRFHGHGSLRYVYKQGRAVRSHLATLKFSPNPRRKESRLAVVISKKVHKSAVGRNRIRRRIYEILHTPIQTLPKAHDIVVIISSGDTLHLSPDELRHEILLLLQEAGLYTDHQ